MSRLFTISSALALAIAAPAIAQQAAPAPVPAGPVTAQPEIAPTPAPAPMEPSAEPTAPAPAATPAPAAAPSPAAPTAAVTQEAQVTALVETEFPSYDADKTGDLSQAEFTTWVMALQAKAAEAGDANAKKMDDAAKAKWAQAAFASADTDKSKKINKAEMGKFLLG